MACQGTQDVGWTRGHPWVGVGVSMGVGGREVMAVGGGVGGGGIGVGVGASTRRESCTRKCPAPHSLFPPGRFACAHTQL